MVGQLAVVSDWSVTVNVVPYRNDCGHVNSSQPDARDWEGRVDDQRLSFGLQLCARFHR
jgi:hypothetical protein